jgi:putative ABC transport system ATP-binding protein
MMAEDEIVLEAHGLCKTFSSGSGKLDVLNGVDLCVRRGEMVAVMWDWASVSITALESCREVSASGWRWCAP